MKVKFIVIFFVLQTLMIFVISQLYSSKKENLLTHKTQELQKQYQSINSYFDKIANTVFEGYINRSENIEAFASGDREKLFALLKKDYDFIQNINMLQVHFHNKNNTSFLRLYKPKMYGDNLEKARYSVGYVNKYHKPVKSLEIGKVAPGFKYVYPLFDKNQNYIGSVENSFSIMAFINQLELLYTVHTHFLVFKKCVDGQIDPDSKKLFTTAIENQDFYKLQTENCKMGDNKSNQKQVLFEGIYKNIVDKGLQTKKPFSIEFIINDTTKIATFLPLKNIKKEHIGYFVFYHDSQELKDINRELYKRLIIFGFIITLITLIFYKISSQKALLKEEVRKQTEKFQKANQELESKTQQLNELNNSLEDKIKSEIDKNRQKEFELMEASKMVQMGEMIGNIAHQWRQPLSVISTISTGIQLNKELDMLDESTLIPSMEKINSSAQYLSETINTFRNFIKEKKELKIQTVQENIKNALDIVGTVLKDVNIQLIKEIEDESIKVYIVSGELPQVIINIINNAKDIILEKEIKDGWVKITLYKDNDKAVITIEDNGGGVPEEILSKIFNPYFSTKEENIGTGLGLHMSKRIVLESLKGNLYVKNSAFGALFFIEIPLNQ
jgi:signal transduction histidine kinase